MSGTERDTARQTAVRRPQIGISRDGGARNNNSGKPWRLLFPMLERYRGDVRPRQTARNFMHREERIAL